MTYGPYVMTIIMRKKYFNLLAISWRVRGWNKRCYPLSVTSKNQDRNSYIFVDFLLTNLSGKYLENAALAVFGQFNRVQPNIFSSRLAFCYSIL